MQRKWNKWWLLAVVFCAPIFLLLVGASLTPLPRELRDHVAEQSIRVEDRNGDLLREVRSKGGALSSWLALSDLPATLPRALVAVEDRRFYYHPGIDPLATARALLHDVWRLRVVSGASTITMQLARTLRPHRRNLWGKWQEMQLALRIEASLSKHRILEEYLNRVDFGPNLRGVGAAAQACFGKPVAALSLAQIALLVGLPQAPSAYILHHRETRAAARRDYVLTHLQQAGIATPAAVTAARAEPLLVGQRHSLFGAPHLVAILVNPRTGDFLFGMHGAGTQGASRIRTTLDPELQRAAETALSATIPPLREHNVNAGAALVVDNASGEVLAYVGSPDFFDARRQGQVDGVRALRQPGSTLKPFVYAAAIDELGYTGATILPDLPLQLPTGSGTYAPRNFDDKFHGPVRLREALGNSLNIPAVYVTEELGAAVLLRYLHQFGFDSLQQKPEFYGPALALGDGEVTLGELVRAYATLARGGLLLPLHVATAWERLEHDSAGGATTVTHYQPQQQPRVISSAAAELVTDMLSDNGARAASFGLESALRFDARVAAKTGTSKGFRDNWVVGYTRRVTVGVWVGNFDGTPMRGVSGITGAGPTFRAIMQAALVQYPETVPLASMGVQDQHNNQTSTGLTWVAICPLSGAARGPDCPLRVLEYVPEGTVLPECRWHQRLAIDRRNGLLAGAGCAPVDTSYQLFEVLPSEYFAWAKEQGHPIAPDTHSPNCPETSATVSHGANSELKIIEPLDGAHFVIDPERPLQTQQLTITVAAPTNVRDVSLEVDDAHFAHTRPPFEFHWTLREGHHRLVALTSTGLRSSVVEVVIRAVH